MNSISSFKGLNNVSDPLRLGLAWLAQADNVNVSDTGALEKREGYSLALDGAVTALFSTRDYSRAYLVADGELKAMVSNTEAVTLRTGLADAPMSWAEINEQVFFTNGTDSGIVLADNRVIDWAWPVPPIPEISTVSGRLPAGLYRVCFTYRLADGRNTGAGDHAEIEVVEGQALQITGIPQLTGLTTNVYIAPANSTVFQFAGTATGGAMVWNRSPDALGHDLPDVTHSPLPMETNVIAQWRGRIYAGQSLPEHATSVVRFSQPLGFHLFDLAKDFFTVPGAITMLCAHAQGLIVGTDKDIYAYDGERLTMLASYGVPPGQHWEEDDSGRIVFWSNRGLCSGLPFTNLTDRQVSVPPGVSAGGAIVRRGGQRRYVVSLQQGGTAFNPH